MNRHNWRFSKTLSERGLNINTFCLKPCGIATIIFLVAACSGNNSSTEPVKEDASLYAAAAARQNDTGIVFSGNHPRTINETCQVGIIDPDDEWSKGEDFPKLELVGQDCEHGRDATHYDDSDGDAGFSFTKVGGDGALLSADADRWSCVVDNVTGLMWEVKTPAGDDGVSTGLHTGTDRFSWYSTDSANNGGNIGDWNRDRDDCYGYQAGSPGTFCNTQAFVERVNSAGLCSYSDWRLPTLMELTSVIHFGRTEPAIDAEYFPNTSHRGHWVDAPVAGFEGLARMIELRFGGSTTGMRMDRNSAMLVRTHTE